MLNADYSEKSGECESPRQPDLNCEHPLLKARRLGAEWRDLCARFLPVSQENSSWRYSHNAGPDDVEQGWKLHISATILNACEVLKKVAPCLVSRGVRFKAPASLQLLYRLNSGLSFAYTQVGKCITVYPRDTDEAVRLARRLHTLTSGICAPAVPFDLQYRPNSCIYYRYGAFRYMETEDSDGDKVPAIRDLSGKLIPDQRDQAKPSWLDDPFQYSRQPGKSIAKSAETPLKTKYKIFRALKQRGKGGVYQAIDIGAEQPRLCIVKEGRNHGEVGWDGYDGFEMIKYEAEVLSALETTNINAPLLYSTFEVGGNFYLASEFIEGKSLEKLMRLRRRRFSIRQVLRYAAQIAELLARIHEAGWVWRDCKPGNLVVTSDNLLRPLDFESACRIGDSSFSGWRTVEFSAPEDELFSSKAAGEAEDIYSFGTVIYFLLTAEIYCPESPRAIKDLRRKVPVKAGKLIEKMLVLPIRKNRPAAKYLAREFGKLSDF